MFKFRFILGTLVMSLSLFTVTGFAQTTSATSTTPAASSTAMKVTPATKGSKNKVDLNNADAATLAKIKGIGPKKAQAIVDYRTKNGNFASVDDLKNVKSAKGKAYFNAKNVKRLNKKLTV